MLLNQIISKLFGTAAVMKTEYEYSDVVFQLIRRIVDGKMDECVLIGEEVYQAPIYTNECKNMNVLF